MKAYVRSKAHSEAQSEISGVLSNPLRELEENWERWFRSITPQQRRYVLIESDLCIGPGDELPSI